LHRLSLRFSLVAVLIVLAFLAAWPIATTCTAAAAGLGVTGSLLDVTMPPGTTYVHTMTVSNGFTYALDMQVAARGLGQGLDGSYLPLTKQEDQSPYSALTYITQIDKSSFHLEPGASEVVKATINAPLDAAPGTRYACVYIYSQPTGEDQVGVSVAAIVPVVVNVPGFAQIKAGEIAGLNVSELKSGQPIQISTTFKNMGNYHYKARNQVTIRDTSGKAVSSTATMVTASSIIPTFSRLFTTFSFVSDPVNGLPPGEYSVESKVMLDDGTLLDVETTSLTVPEWYEPIPGIDESTLVIKTFGSGETPYLDAIERADIEVLLLGPCDIGGTIIVAKYQTEPPGIVSLSESAENGGLGKTPVKWIYVRIVGCDQGLARLIVHYADDEIRNLDPDSLTLAYFDGAKWQECLNVTLDAEARTVSGEVSVAAVSTGTPVALGGDRLPAAGVNWTLIIIAVLAALVVVPVVIFVVVRWIRMYTYREG
jgi:hypothetical protein